MNPLVLASSSPRRREILSLLELPFEVKPATFETPIDQTLSLDEAVMNVARKKAKEIAALYPNRVVIGADTVVSIDGKVLGKPHDDEQARLMLRLLQGREHEVLTGVWVCLPSPDKGHGFTDKTKVTFYPLSEQDICDYVSTGEPLDKAGAYGIQGIGLRNIRCIQGDYYTVMGLPGARLWRLLKQCHVVPSTESK
jgi:septum formation protein